MPGAQTGPPPDPTHGYPPVSSKMPESNPDTPRSPDFVSSAGASQSMVPEIGTSPQLSQSQDAQYKADLEAKEQEIKELRVLWKQAASDLNKYKAQGHGFELITDEMLKQKSAQLRYNVESLAVQHFGSRVSSPERQKLHNSLKDIRSAIGSDTIDVRGWLLNPAKRPLLVQAYLWQGLLSKIFKKYYWVARDAASCMDSMCEFLEPRFTDLDAQRRFNIWRANTSTLLYNCMTDQEKAEASARLFDLEIQRASETLDPFTATKSKELFGCLERLVDEALEFDLMVSKQAADVTWRSPARGKILLFESGSMEVQRGEEIPREDRTVALVVAPALYKRGRSTGEDLEHEKLIIAMEVCLGSPLSAVERLKIIKNRTWRYIDEFANAMAGGK